MDNFVHSQWSQDVRRHPLYYAGEGLITGWTLALLVFYNPVAASAKVSSLLLAARVGATSHIIGTAVGNLLAGNNIDEGISLVTISESARAGALLGLANNWILNNIPNRSAFFMAFPGLVVEGVRSVVSAANVPCDVSLGEQIEEGITEGIYASVSGLANSVSAISGPLGIALTTLTYSALSAFDVQLGNPCDQ